MRLPTLSLFVCGALLACSKSSAPKGTEGEAVASVGPAPEGVVVRRIHLRCSREPCAGGACEVTCPPQPEMFRIDITDSLGGKVSVRLEGLEVFSGQTEPSMIGLGATVDIRPIHWPANVTVQVGERSGALQIERSKPFVRAHGKVDGPLLFETRAERFMYE